VSKIHIVSFDVPYPPDYGGAIDVFYKIKALAEAGAEIYLHCFEYGRKQSKELKQLCKEVWYYPRLTGMSGLSFSLPYIVNSRRNKDLLSRLIAIEAPILFEGVHTTYYLSNPQLRERFKAVRVHNIEHVYYNELKKKEPNKLKQYYYGKEAELLKKYEESLQSANAFFPLSMEDGSYFKGRYGNAIHDFIGPFHPFNEVNTLPGKGKYCLYHGNLAHAENKEAILFLLNEVFPHVTTPVIIAGREPSQEIFEACKTVANCKLVANPSQHEMEVLIQEAHIHVLPTFQATGMKLKLLYALFSGRHVLVNKDMLHGTGLEQCCLIADSAEDFCHRIEQSIGQSFTSENIAVRREILMQHYNNRGNAKKLLTHLLH
jgi:hypothetical protein